MSESSGSVSPYASAPDAGTTDQDCLDGARDHRAGRTAEYLRRVCVHETAGHGLVTRASGNIVELISAIPYVDENGIVYAGRCIRRGAQAMTLHDDRPPSTAQIVDVCSRAVSEIGEIREAEVVSRAILAATELVAGHVAEKIFGYEPLPAAHDDIEAKAFAGVACLSSDSIPAMIEQTWISPKLWLGH